MFILDIGFYVPLSHSNTVVESKLPLIYFALVLAVTQKIINALHYYVLKIFLSVCTFFHNVYHITAQELPVSHVGSDVLLKKKKKRNS